MVRFNLLRQAKPFTSTYLSKNSFHYDFSNTIHKNSHHSHLDHCYHVAYHSFHHLSHPPLLLHHNLHLPYLLDIQGLHHSFLNAIRHQALQLNFINQYQHVIAFMIVNFRFHSHLQSHNFHLNLTLLSMLSSTATLSIQYDLSTM